MTPTTRAAAAALAAAASFTLTVTPAAAVPPDPAAWTVTIPTPAATHGIATRHLAKPAQRAPEAAPAAARTATRRPARVAGVRRSWRASSTCRATVRAGEERTWWVGPGDTLDLIARCHPGVTVDRLRARNGLRSDLIRVRTRLVIPAARA